MTEGGHRIAAEVWPESGQHRAAAAALQDLGFRVRHLGMTISVDAPVARWGEVFGDAAPTGDLPVPAALRHLVREVSIVPPPDLHG